MKTRLLLSSVVLAGICAHATTLHVDVKDLQYVTGYAGSYEALPTEGTVDLPAGTFMQYGDFSLQVLSDLGTSMTYDAASQSLILPTDSIKLTLQCASQTTGMTFALDRVTVTQLATVTDGWAPVYYVPFTATNGRSQLVADGDNYTWTPPAGITDVIEIELTTAASGNQITAFDIEYGDIKIPAPTIAGPENGFDTPQSVTITSSVGATIYYTTDGTDATTSSTIYTGAFEISTSTTVHAIAYVYPGYISPQAEHVFYDAEAMTTVDDLTSKKAPGVIYNIQGIRQQNPSGLCIDAQGHKFLLPRR